MVNEVFVVQYLGEGVIAMNADVGCDGTFVRTRKVAGKSHDIVLHEGVDWFKTKADADAAFVKLVDEQVKKAEAGVATATSDLDKCVRRLKKVKKVQDALNVKVA